MSDITSKTDEELVKDVGKTVIGTPSGLKAQYSQAELMRRLIFAIDNLNRTTSYYSKVLILLTITLGVLTVVQIILFLR